MNIINVQDPLRLNNIDPQLKDNISNQINSITNNELGYKLTQKMRANPEDMDLCLRAATSLARLYEAPRSRHDAIFKQIQHLMIEGSVTGVEALYSKYKQNLEHSTKAKNEILSSKHIVEKKEHTPTNSLRIEYIKKTLGGRDLHPLPFTDFSAELELAHINTKAAKSKKSKPSSQKRISRSITPSPMADSLSPPGLGRSSSASSSSSSTSDGFMSPSSDMDVGATENNVGLLEDSYRKIYESSLDALAADPNNKQCKLIKHQSFATLCSVSKRTAHDLLFNELKEQMKDRDINSLYRDYEKLCVREMSLHQDFIQEAETIAKELNTPQAYEMAKNVNDILFFKVNLCPMDKEEFEKIAVQEGAIFRPIPISRKRKIDDSSPSTSGSLSSSSTSSTSTELPKASERPPFTFPY